MLDLTSSSYLGFRHASAELGRWSALTTGAPAALREPVLAPALAAQLAALVGAQAGVLVRSTLHAFTDLATALAGRPVLLDEHTYPVAQLPLRAAACGRAGPAPFPHHDTAGLARRLARGTGAPPVVVTDGWCVGCAQAAPLRDYLELLRTRGGLLVVDDTQALGVLGEQPGPGRPYGQGGGGCARWAGVHGPGLVVVASLAKAFGAPTAVLCGEADLVGRLARDAVSRVHTSPPSSADLAAAARALTRNASEGEGLRARLLGLVRRLRACLLGAGLRVARGEFPVQRLAPSGPAEALAWQQRLLRAGLRTVLTRPTCRRGTSVTLVVTAALTPADVDRAAELVVRTRPGARPARAVFA